MTIRPIGKNLLCKKVSDGDLEVTPGGIIMPNTSGSNTEIDVIVAVGPECSERSQFLPGQKVCVMRTRPWYTVGEYQIIPEIDVLGVYEGDVVATGHTRDDILNPKEAHPDLLLNPDVDVEVNLDGILGEPN